MPARDVIAGLALLVIPTLTQAQGYRASVQTRVQSVSFRGVQLDSIAATDVDTVDGRLFSSDGYAVSCFTGASHCRFYRAGSVEGGSPWVTTFNATLWGLGITGLRVWTNMRIGVDLATGTVWPGTTPVVQLIEGAAEYERGRFRVVAGRTHITSRLGWQGFDGGYASGAIVRGKLDAHVYGGWGLARGSTLPVTSPALNPIDDYQPIKRQILYGGGLKWNLSSMTGSAFYQREVDPNARKIVSERAGFDGVARLTRGLTFSGGVDYDVARALWGSWEIRANYRTGVGTHVSAGARRYRPHFDLWTIWGAFSPAPHSTVFGSASVEVLTVQLRARAEAYRFDDTEADTRVPPDQRFLEQGWRGSLGATASPLESVQLSVDGHLERGPGAASSGLRGDVAWFRGERTRVNLFASHLLRPLEFRFDESKVWTLGANGSVRVFDQFDIDLGLAWFSENRERPDAAAIDWSGWRMHSGVRWTFGSPVDASGLPAAVLRMPSRGASR